MIGKKGNTEPPVREGLTVLLSFIIYIKVKIEFDFSG